MYCNDVNECFREINAYSTGEPIGSPLLVNVENYSDFQSILQRLEADTNKKCIFVSEHTHKNGLPMIEDVFDYIKQAGEYVLIGVSQAAMLRDSLFLDMIVSKALGLNIKGHAIILLDHCKLIIDRYAQRDPRVNRRVAFVAGENTPLPQIRLTDNTAVCAGFQPLVDIRGLLSYMERMDDEKLARHSALTVLTGFKPTLFKNALYDIGESKGVYEALCEQYQDLAITKEIYGTQDQWNWLTTAMADAPSFSAFIVEKFGSTTNLLSVLPDVIHSTNKYQTWLLWLALKVFSTNKNEYLARTLQNSQRYDDLERLVYSELLYVNYADPLFDKLFSERMRIIDSLPENLPLIDAYCDNVGRHEKNAVYYLTDGSERERYEFTKCLAIYEYSHDEIIKALKLGFPEIECYMQPFVFDEINTKLPETESDFREALTSYFASYKEQKLTNRVQDQFVERVNENAISRPFLKLQPRSSLFAKQDLLDSGVFFFDALGVEYLSYIQSKCEKYGLVFESAIGHSELPSITSANKEFENCGCAIRKISDLDELKHHSATYDYTTCPYPIHLFDELEIIDRELRRIQVQLAQGSIQKAIIVSDHGASRLAVLYGKEVSSSIELDEKGVHSGRCCRCEADPQLPQASYENGYAILANYERFKGGRAANLEVHGGATLEEVLVPLIVLTRKPENVTYCFVDPVIKFKMSEAARITLFSNTTMKSPRISVNGVFYDGTFVGDKKHAEFIMPELKRANTYEAIIYDGNMNVGVTLDFTLERGTKQKNLFGF